MLRDLLSRSLRAWVNVFTEHNGSPEDLKRAVDLFARRSLTNRLPKKSTEEEGGRGSSAGETKTKGGAAAAAAMGDATGAAMGEEKKTEAKRSGVHGRRGRRASLVHQVGVCLPGEAGGDVGRGGGGGGDKLSGGSVWDRPSPHKVLFTLKLVWETGTKGGKGGKGSKGGNKSVDSRAEAMGGAVYCSPTEGVLAFQPPVAEVIKVCTSLVDSMADGIREVTAIDNTVLAMMGLEPSPLLPVGTGAPECAAIDSEVETARCGIRSLLEAALDARHPLHALYDEFTPILTVDTKVFVDEFRALSRSRKAAEALRRAEEKRRQEQEQQEALERQLAMMEAMKGGGGGGGGSSAGVIKNKGAGGGTSADSSKAEDVGGGAAAGGKGERGASDHSNTEGGGSSDVHVDHTGGSSVLLGKALGNGGGVRTALKAGEGFKEMSMYGPGRLPGSMLEEAWRFWTAAAEVRRKTFDEEVIGMICFDCKGIKAELETKCLELAHALIDLAVEEALLESRRLEARYEAMVERIRENPANEGELQALLAFIAKCPSWIREMSLEVEGIVEDLSKVK